jgi:putative hydrolase of the HAD superfamily
MRALIFDFDGLIVDTESAIYEAWRELYESEGHDLPLHVYVQCVGSHFGHYDPIAELERLCARPIDWTARLAVKDARIHELQVGLDTLPGIRPLLQEARAAGLPRAVASSSSRSHVEGWLARCGIRAEFDAVITRDDVARAKPAPDLFLAAARALDCAPQHCLVLEDSGNGLTAAIAAGSPCLIVPSPVTTGLDFTRATAVLPTLENAGLDQLRAIHRRAMDAAA